MFSESEIFNEVDGFYESDMPKERAPDGLAVEGLSILLGQAS